VRARIFFFLAYARFVKNPVGSMGYSTSHWIDLEKVFAAAAVSDLACSPFGRSVAKLRANAVAFVLCVDEGNAS
jgi:hypothetical protein